MLDAANSLKLECFCCDKASNEVDKGLIMYMRCKCGKIVGRKELDIYICGK